MAHQGEPALDDRICQVIPRAAGPRLSNIFSRARKSRAGILRFIPVHDRLSAVDIWIPDVVLFTEFGRDIDMRDVIAGKRVDAIERLAKNPILTQVHSDLVEARLRIAGKAVCELSVVVA